MPARLPHDAAGFELGEPFAEDRAGPNGPDLTLWLNAP